LPKVCDVYLKARDDGVLLKSQEKFARACDLLMRGLAHVGIVALVDEATGYQEVRDRLALQEILDKFLRKEFATWAKRFPDEFYQGIFRLRNWQWRGMKVNRPQIVAHYTKDLVYARLAPGILRELEARNPLDARGHRRAKHHQYLTDDIGHPALAQHLYGVNGLMRVTDKWDEFMRLMDKAYPRRGDTLQMALFQDDDFAISKQM
jgi:P63C domain